MLLNASVSTYCFYSVFFFLTVAGWVFIVVHRLSLVVVCVDFFFFSCCISYTGSVVVAHGL